jgi:hypothetical protein
LTGKRFGNLTALSLDGHAGSHRAWKCRCDCGTTKKIDIGNLVAGRTQSCGCQQGKELATGVAQMNSMFATYRRSAVARGFEFKLSREQFENLVKKSCVYCGEEPKFRQKKELSSGVLANGIDRLDSLSGYLLENCVPCCRVCNRAKSDMTLEEFKAWVARVHNNFLTK